jgi:protease-4
LPTSLDTLRLSLRKTSHTPQNGETAVQIAAKAAKLNEGEYNLKFYPEQQSFVEKLLKTGEVTLKERALKSELGEMYPLYKEIQRVKSMQGTQARIPYYEVIQ